MCEKCLVRIEESVTTGGLYRPTHLCVAHFELHKKKVAYSFFFGVVRLGGVWREGWVGEMVHVSGGRGLHGVSEGCGVI